MDEAKRAKLQRKLRQLSETQEELQELLEEIEDLQTETTSSSATEIQVKPGEATGSGSAENAPPSPPVTEVTVKEQSPPVTQVTAPEAPQGKQRYMSSLKNQPNPA